MKANKRIRDLSRRRVSGVRQYCEYAKQFVTTHPFTKDEKGKRVPVAGLKRIVE